MTLMIKLTRYRKGTTSFIYINKDHVVTIKISPQQDDETYHRSMVEVELLINGVVKAVIYPDIAVWEF